MGPRRERGRRAIDDVTEAEPGFFQEHGYLPVEEFLDGEGIEAAVDGMPSLLERAAGDGDARDGVVGILRTSRGGEAAKNVNYLDAYYWTCTT